MSIKTSILDAGLAMWPHVSVRGLARRIGVTHTAVLYYFSDLDGLRSAVASHAVETDCSRVICHLITEKHPAIGGMLETDRRRHMLNLCNAS
jgi:AcrR family transcriptional regulator